MVQQEEPGKGLASSLLLNIKALTALYPSDANLKKVLDESLVDYTDEDVKRLADILRPGRRESRVGGVLVAVSEILFASFLAILGIGAFVPGMIGIQSPAQIFNYFAGKLSPSFGAGPLADSASAIVLVFSALLIAGALYLLRRASLELKSAGIEIETSGN